MISVISRGFLVGLLGVALATSGCVTTDTGPETGLTSEQQLLRDQKARWNQTVLIGAVAGTAAGAATGAAVSGGSAQGTAIGAAIGLAAGTLGGVFVANRNLEFENRQLSAQQRVAAARTATQNLESRAATSEMLARNDRARLDQLDAQYRSKQITAAEYRTQAAPIRKDVALMKESAQDANTAREKIGTSSAEVPQLAPEAPKMGAAQRRLESSADQIEEKLNRIPST
jgi:hypothetical protein